MSNEMINKKSLTVSIVIFYITYSIFMPDRIKNNISMTVNDRVVTNELIIIPMLFILYVILSKVSLINIIFIEKYYTRSLYFLTFVVVIGAFKVVSPSQYLYAALIFLIPMLTFYFTSRLNKEQIVYFYKYLIIVSIIYGLLSILVSTNFSSIMNLIGNDGAEYTNYSHYRAPLMIGSSITVSYFFNLTLPILLFMYLNFKNSKWKIITLLAVILNLIGTFILLSRLASLASILIIFIFLVLNTFNKKNIKKRFVIFLFTAIGIFISLKSFDVSRILEGLNFMSNSDKSRFASNKLGLEIFQDNFIIGSGVGRFFERIYNNRYITYENQTGLIDPHNLYVLMLSEIGIVGLIIMFYLIFSITRRVIKSKDKNFRIMSLTILLVISFISLGGSHLMNEISFSIVFWSILGTMIRGKEFEQFPDN